MISLKQKFNHSLAFVQSLFIEEQEVRKLPDRRLPGVVPELLKPFDLVGDAWYSSDNLPIAICWGFNPWKRAYIQAYLPGIKLAFVRGSRVYLDLKKFIKRLPSHREVRFYAWGTKLPYFARRFAKRRGLSVHYVEDGFLRSFNPGALHSKPWSLTFDSKAPYYETSKATDLQALLSAVEKKRVNPRHQELGKAGIALMRALRLTKYFPLNITDHAWAPPPTDGRKIVLLLGQVEDDAAVLAGYSVGLFQRLGLFRRRFSNLRIVKKAAKDHPGAYLVYRPHPDTFHNGRASRHEKRIAKLCTVIDPTVPLQSLFPHVAHVYSGTSLSAFEAALWGLPVTTLGFPFYAATPSINALQGPRNGFAKLDLSDLFAIIYLDYPRYIHPDTEEKASFFDLASYFFVTKFKHLVLNGIPRSVLDLDVLRQNEAYLAPPAKLFLYLLALGRTGKEDINEFKAIFGETVRYEDVAQCVELLITAARIELLQVFIEKTMLQFIADIEELKSRPITMLRVFEALSESQVPLRGRLEITLPDLTEWLLPEGLVDYEISDSLILAYARALSNNLQYDVLEEILSRLERPGKTSQRSVSIRCIRGFAALVVAKPARSERNANKRAHLIERIGSLYHRMLLNNSDSNPIFARALVALALDRPYEIKKASGEILGRITSEAEEGLDDLLRELRQQKSMALSLARYLERYSESGLVDSLFEHLDGDDTAVKIEKMRSSLMRQKFNTFHTIYSSLEEQDAAQNSVSDLIWKSQIEQNKFHDSKKNIEGLLSQKNVTPERCFSLYEAKEKVEFFIDAEAIIESIPQPNIPKGVVFLATFSDFNTVASLVPVLREIRRLGYAIVSLCDGILSQAPTGFPAIDQFMGIIQNPNAAPARKNSYHNEWEINWSKRIIRSNDINFYQGFYERLSNASRRVDVDINDADVGREFYKRLATSDSALHVCKRILSDIACQKIPAIIISGSSHVAPHSIFRDFCLAKSHPFLSFVSISMGYENYFNNLGGRFATTMTVADMTLHPTHRAPFLPRADRFERWYAQERDNPIYQRRASELIGYNRVHQRDDSVSQTLQQRLNEQRTKGRKIVACFGKIPIDLGVPYDGGPGHEDLRDWLNHTIDAVRGCEDIILLVKPHPHELQPSIALDLIDRFTDLIKLSIPDNVWILGHRDINNHQLAAHLDLALLWNGSSGLELTALGVPVMMASHFGRYDYPIELLYPQNRDDYGRFIRSMSWPKPNLETRHRAAALIAYTETSDVTIRNDYAWRAVTNDKVGMPSFRRDRVEQLLRDGDPEMERAAARILERFEGGAA
jgi:capsular polysaccharide export protein